ISPFTQVHVFTVQNNSIVIIFSEAGESFELTFNSPALETLDKLIQLAQDGKQKLVEANPQQSPTKLDSNPFESLSQSMQPICSEFSEKK
ncbi:MAG: hypothetical protein ACRC8Y_19995, partial [Chroococcales cyanobacterium]